MSSLPVTPCEEAPRVSGQEYNPPMRYLRMAVLLAMAAALAVGRDVTGTWKGDLRGGYTSRTLFSL